MLARQPIHELVWRKRTQLAERFRGTREIQRERERFRGKREIRRKKVGEREMWWKERYTVWREKVGEREMWWKERYTVWREKVGERHPQGYVRELTSGAELQYDG